MDTEIELQRALFPILGLRGSNLLRLFGQSQRQPSRKPVSRRSYTYDALGPRQSSSPVPSDIEPMLHAFYASVKVQGDEEPLGIGGAKYGSARAQSKEADRTPGGIRRRNLHGAR